MKPEQRRTNLKMVAAMIRKYQASIDRHKRLPDEQQDAAKLARFQRHIDWWKALKRGDV